MEHENDPVTITSVTVRNFRRLTFALVKHLPGKGLIRVTGANQSGKSSFLAAIHGVFGGARAVDQNTLTQGEVEGEAKVALSNGWTIERRFTPSQPKGYLYVRGPNDEDGKQGTLDEWMGAHSFDPQAFWSLTADRQREILFSLSQDPELPVKLDAIRAELSDAYSERTGVISRVRSLRSVKPPEGRRPEVPDPSTLMERVDELRAQERQEQEAWEEESEEFRSAQEMVNSAQARVGRSKEEFEKASEEVRELERKLLQARRAMANAEAAVMEAQDALHQTTAFARNTQDPGPKPDRSEEVAHASQAVRDAMAAKEGLKEWDRWQESQKELEDLQAQKAELDDRVAQARAVEKGLLQDANIPVSGLTFNEDGEFLLGGVPLSVASGSEKVVMAIEVGMALNPRVRVILLDEEANTMDDATLRKVHDLGVDRGFQIMAARVVEDPGSEVIVNNGIATGGNK